MAFLGGLFGGGSKSTTTTTSTTAVDNTVGVEVSAEISPTINTAVDLTGFSDAIGKVAETLQTVAKSVAAEKTAEEGPLKTLSQLGGAATAILAILTIGFALLKPQDVKVQL